MQKIKCLTVETLLDLYMNYLREKIKQANNFIKD